MLLILTDVIGSEMFRTVLCRRPLETELPSDIKWTQTLCILKVYRSHSFWVTCRFNFWWNIDGILSNFCLEQYIYLHWVIEGHSFFRKNSSESVGVIGRILNFSHLHSLLFYSEDSSFLYQFSFIVTLLRLLQLSVFEISLIIFINSCHRILFVYTLFTFWHYYSF